MLQTYLNANLLSLTDDGDFKKLKKSSDDVAKKLSKDRAKIVSYALSSIDPGISADNSDIVEVKEIIIKNWSTFTSNTKDTPLTYIRAVILEALKALSNDINIAVLIWLSTRNIVKYYKFTEQEKRVVIEYLSELGKRLNAEANSSWSLSIGNDIPKSKIEFKAFSAYLINDTSLQKYLEDASGPQNSEGAANFASPNPYWPNSADSWSFQFAPKAAKGIKTIVDLSLKAIANTVTENQKNIETGISHSLEKSTTALFEKSKSLQIRSELLWWKESCYSPSIDESYRELSEGTIEVIIAYDYSSFIPVVYPKSVDYFLKEMYSTLTDKDKDESKIESLIELLLKNSDQLQTVLPNIDLKTGKITLLDFITGILWGKYTLDQFEKLLGFPSTTIISSSDLTLWLFHDFQLSKALNFK